MSSWSCPYDLDGVCQKVRGARCDPGMRGCVLHGRYVFAKDEAEASRKPIKSDSAREGGNSGSKPRKRLPF